MLRAPQLTMRAGSAALASCSSSSASSSAMPALPPRGSGAKQRRRSPFSSSTQTLIARAGNATEEASKAANAGMDDCADNIGDFCSLDKSVGGLIQGQRRSKGWESSSISTDEALDFSPTRAGHSGSLRPGSSR